jgi:hypothetical protein
VFLTRTVGPNGPLTGVLLLESKADERGNAGWTTLSGKIENVKRKTVTHS